MKRQAPLVVASLAIGLTVGTGVFAQPSKCTMARIEEWPVRLERNHLLVDGAINGRKIGIVLDTGATRSMILRAAAVRLDLPRREASGIRMFGIGGETRVEVAVIDEFRIGKTALKDWRLLAAGEGDFAEGVEVLLGEDFFHRFDVEFDLAHDMVRLFQTRNCDGVSLAYWTKDVVGVAEIESISVDRPQINLTVHVNGQPVRAMLDSGAAISLLSRRDAAAVGMAPESPGVVAAGKRRGLGPRSVDAWIGPIRSFAIGSETIRDTSIQFADLYEDVRYATTGSNLRRSAEQTQPMLLGADFLRAHRTLVAHSQRKLYFTYVGGPVFATGPTEAQVSPRPEIAVPPAANGN